MKSNDRDGDRILFQQVWYKKQIQVAIISAIVALAFWGLAGYFLTRPDKQTQAIVFFVVGALSAIWGVVSYRDKDNRTVFSLDKIEELRGDQVTSSIPLDEAMEVSFGRRANSNFMRLFVQAANGKSALLATTKRPGSESSDYEPSPEALLAVRDHLYSLVEKRIRNALSKNESFEVGPGWTISEKGVLWYDELIPWKDLHFKCNDSNGAIILNNKSKFIGSRSLTEPNAVPAAIVCVERAAVGEWS